MVIRSGFLPIFYAVRVKLLCSLLVILHGLSQAAPTSKSPTLAYVSLVQLFSTPHFILIRISCVPTELPVTCQQILVIYP